MENNHDIDKKFNEASQSSEEPATFPGFDKVWAKVEEKLDKKEDKKRTVPVWFPYGIAASLIIGLGAFYFIDRNENSHIDKPAIATNTVVPEIQSNVKTTDSLIKSNLEKELSSQSEIQKPEVVAYDAVLPPPIPVLDPPALPRHHSDPAYQVIPEAPVYANVITESESKPKDIREVIVTGALGLKKRQDVIVSSNAIVDNSYISQSTNPNTYIALSGKATGITINSSGKRKMSKSDSNNTLNPQVNQIAGNQKGYFDSTPYNNNVLNSLRGTVGGLKINSGFNQNITIRGAGTLSGANQPIYVVNGVVQTGNILGKIDPKSIESVQILKDASATALYGSRAANGVVVVTTKKLSRKERKAFKKLQKVQDSINRARQIHQQNSEEYDAFVENPFELTKNQSVSTFSIDVDKAAYSNIRRMINNGEVVNRNAVRIEEMINYFKYNYPQPKNSQPFSINTEYNDSPWNSQHKLLKIGLQGKDLPMEKLPNSNFVFLIDVSGSMNAANKLPLLKSSFKVLLDQLRPTDKVGIVVYAGSAGMVLPPTSAKEKNKIIEALDQLEAGGSTAGGAGIELAYKLAQENFIKGGNNRVIIATDGDFNVGTSSTGDLQTLIEEKRKSGVFLTCLGFGMGNFKDNRMETLANKGNGNYAYIDNLQEDNKFLGKEFAGTLYAIAKDVKIQIEFNPKYVKSYRLIGYENRKLKNEDFSNDKIDAGELGSGHTVTALYEIIPADVKSEFLPKESDLKYTKNTNDGNFSDELATVKFRYKKPDGDTSSEIVQIVKNSNENLSSASDDFKFASAVAWFGLVLRNSDLIKNKDLKEVEKLGKKGRGNDEDGYRAEYVRLVETYRNSNK
ncbi:vWA domain-containing protein [Chryseobacterium caseinilyticum]|uniref:von Willebrand factor type A domain-containing protein n=1 Tax=Chryseobacterium caseinilyticum TaxID=2771428 RepID=A0ABR8ZD17_9FLAO|nr:VWA domain-containing protein [Chryseobacterium caseinilyticum]MBD8082738.1 von Willebrand factor type A domain-containing protein [Chryseobacterium caseinilyticum]